MSKKLFVGGLDWNTSDASLANAFAQYGSVSEAKVSPEAWARTSRLYSRKAAMSAFR